MSHRSKREDQKPNLPDFLPLPRIFLIFTGIVFIIITLYLLFMYEKISSSMQQAAITGVFFVVLPAVYAIAIFRSLKRQMDFLQYLSPKLEMLSMQISNARSSLSLVLDGKFRDLKIQFSPFSLGKDRFDFYMITMYYPKPLDMNLLCTNTGYLVGKNALSVSFRKHFGLRKTSFPGLYDDHIKCWVADKEQDLRLFKDENIKYTIIKFNEILRQQSACFLMDHTCLRIAFPIEIFPESATIDTAYELCQCLNSLDYREILPEAKIQIKTQTTTGSAVSN